MWCRELNIRNKCCRLWLLACCLVPAAELLRRTEENKERRYKERLNDYYKRNFKVCMAGSHRSV